MTHGWKTAVATLITINLNPRVNPGMSSCLPPKRGTVQLPTFSTQGFCFILKSWTGFVSLKPRLFGRKLRWMWVAKRWPSSIDSGRTCTFAIFFLGGPRTQRTLVLIEKDLVLEGWPSKIEVSWVLGKWRSDEDGGGLVKFKHLFKCFL